MTVTCTRKLHFDAAHRVLEHKSKCKMLHGHRYVVEVTLKAKELTKEGFVMDFGDIKEKLGSWIDSNWDHNTILSKDDKNLGDFIEKETGQKVFYLPYNPTAENMALYLMNVVCAKIFDGATKCVKITIYETPNCFAEVEM